MLRLERASVRINGADILRDISLHVPSNAFAAVVGKNGAGKTTLFRTIMNIVPVWSGEIFVGGRCTTRDPPHRHARAGVGYMPEDRRLVPDWTVEQNVLLPAWVCKRPDARGRVNAIYDLIPEVGKVAGRRALELSGGQQKLVALARALNAATTLMILDEPFEGVAPALVQRLIEILSTLRARGELTILISESDAVHSARLVDSVHRIERGRMGFANGRRHEEPGS